MRTKVAQVKSDNPTKSPKDIFAMCAAMWATAPENPKSSAAAALPPAKSEKGSLKSGRGRARSERPRPGESGRAPGRASHREMPGEDTELY